MRKLVLAVSLAFIAALLVPAVAAATPTLQKLAKTVAALQQQVNTQKTQIAALNAKLTAAKPVLALAPYVSVTQNALDSVTGPNIVFKGANVHVRSTTSETDASGTGNLIVGWDPPLVTPPLNFRTGSNNLVVGVFNDFRGYGGFVAGWGNAIWSSCSSVSGGSNNDATSDAASVSGGYGNGATGGSSSVSGGCYNFADAACSSVSGGYDLTEGTQYGWATAGYHSP